MNDFTTFTPPNVHPFDAEAEIRALKDRVSALEALLTPKGTPFATDSLYEMLTRPISLQRERTSDHARFIPDYGSEGEY